MCCHHFFGSHCIIDALYLTDTDINETRGACFQVFGGQKAAHHGQVMKMRDVLIALKSIKSSPPELCWFRALDPLSKFTALPDSTGLSTGKGHPPHFIFYTSSTTAASGIWDFRFTNFLTVIVSL